jgi:DNA-directed RNA polymerase alpha subunit
MRSDFKTMRMLLNCVTEGNLLQIRNFGRKCCKELLQKLYDMGYITYDQAVDYAEANKVNQFETVPWAPMVHERKEGIA